MGPGRRRTGGESDTPAATHHHITPPIYLTHLLEGLHAGAPLPNLHNEAPNGLSRRVVRRDRMSELETSKGMSGR